MKYISIDADGVVASASDRPIESASHRSVALPRPMDHQDLIGRRAVRTADPAGLRVAVVCNWRFPCGISTYAKYLVDALRPKVGEVLVLSEHGGDTSEDEAEGVVRCWKRGESMREAVRLATEWRADFVLVQHEFGIFPKASHFLQMLHALGNMPYAVVLHSVYADHMDKTVMTAAARNIVVHTVEAERVLRALGHDVPIHVIPHGCVSYGDVTPLWNAFRTPYAVVQFGFGFNYKGVDRAIEAVSILKGQGEKYADMFYCYLCSTTAHGGNTHSSYVQSLNRKIEEFGVQDNVAIIQKFQSDGIINNYLRTAKLAIFPYLVDPGNTVYGASGAVRIAMANGCPVIASESHLFDDFEGVIPRPASAGDLAKEMGRVFSDGKYRQGILDRSKAYVADNTWDISAARYAGMMADTLLGGDYVCLEN